MSFSHEDRAWSGGHLEKRGVIVRRGVGLVVMAMGQGLPGGRPEVGAVVVVLDLAASRGGVRRRLGMVMPMVGQHVHDETECQQSGHLPNQQQKRGAQTAVDHGRIVPPGHGEVN